MMPLNDGDATFTSSFAKLGWDEAGNQYEAGFKPPKGTKFVVMLLGTAPKDATDYDLEAALARLGFVRQEVEDTADRIVNGYVILDGMAFNKAEILTQRKDLCDALEELEAMRDQITDLRTMLEKILPLAEQHLDLELFEGSVKEMEAALELIREAKEILS